MYKNSDIFLPMVQKAQKENSLDLLLAGREGWRIIEQDVYGDYPNRPTDWRGLYLFGIYEVYRKGEYIIKNELENAIVNICKQKCEDSAYMAVLAWYTHLYFEYSSIAPFCLKKERILDSIQKCLKNNKSRLLMSTKWVYTDEEYPNNEYNEIKMLNNNFRRMGIDLLEGIE